MAAICGAVILLMIALIAFVLWPLTRPGLVRWDISGVEFSKILHEDRISIWLFDTFLPFSWFFRGVMIAGMIMILFSIRLISKSVMGYPHSGKGVFQQTHKPLVTMPYTFTCDHHPNTCSPVLI